jgi:hypothetical protein
MTADPISPLGIKLYSLYQTVDAIEKHGENKAQGYKYTRSVDVLRAVRARLFELKIYAEINFDFVGDTFTIPREKAPNAPFSAVRVKCSVVFHDLETGETRTASGLGTGCDNNDKSAYKAQTGALKYALKNAFLIPDEAGREMDPEADESVDAGADYSNPEPDFQSAQRGDARPPSRPRGERAAQAPAAASAPRNAATSPKAQTAAAPAASSTTKTSVPNTGFAQSTTAGTSAAPAVATARPASGAPAAAGNPAPAETSDREPGDDEAAGDLNRRPTEAEMGINTKMYRELINEVSDPNKGKLKSSTSLPIPQKVKAFMLDVTKVPNVNELTQAQWLDFFTRVDKIKTSEHGLVGLATLINRACGVEPKPAKAKAKK